MTISFFLSYNPLLAQDQIAQDQSLLTLAEYAEKLRAAQSAIEQSTTKSFALEEVKQSLQTIDTISLPSGVTVPIAPLLSGVKNPTVALQRIETVSDQITRAANDRTQQRLDQLQAILDRRPTNPLTQWWERFLRWLRDFLRQFESNAPPPSQLLTVSETTGWVVMIVGGIILALVLGYWLQGILRNLIRDRRLRRANGEDDLPATAAEARQSAQELALAGNYREAVRRMYLAAVLGLDEAGLIHYDRTLTNREVLAQTSAEAAVQHHLRPVVETFDDVWYGLHEPDKRAYESYVREIDQLETMTKRET